MTNTAPYSASEILAAANLGQKLDPIRVLATYAQSDNWVQIYGGDARPSGYHAKACEWGFIGPMRPGYEMATLALKDLSLRA
jgi:hypothetical protein